MDKIIVQLSPAALCDLDEIWEYIAVKLGNPVAAQSTVEGIMKAIDRLKIFPNAGQPLILLDEIQTDYRFVIYENYLAFYHFADSIVFVDRILYGRRDYMKILFS